MKKALRLAIIGGLAGAALWAQSQFLSATPDPEVMTEPAALPCAFMWAYHDLPDLSAKLDEQVKALQPEASARASAFGEDCVDADGNSTFGAIETDFYITLPVNKEMNEKAFGTWMSQVLPLASAIQPAELQGKPGFVEFWFEGAQTLIVRVPIEQYLADGQALAPADLYRRFAEQP